VVALAFYWTAYEFTVSRNPQLPTHQQTTGSPTRTTSPACHLSAPPTSVPSERVFSTVGDILTDKESRLSTDNAEKLLILKEKLLKF